MDTLFHIPPHIHWQSARLTGDAVHSKVTTLGDLAGVFADQQAYSRLSPQQEVYRVDMLTSPMVEGELHTGITHLQAGRVGEEYFMTRGHFHQRREQAEFYFGLRGTGVLLLQTEQGEVRCEQVASGSVHHIAGFTAHRLINTGADILSALAVWPVMAGHDYQALLPQGFRWRLYNREGEVKVEVQYE
ncbi:MAG: glucose-6-phosphate isomerase family protein [Enterobacteriaceae bacterium]